MTAGTGGRASPFACCAAAVLRDLIVLVAANAVRRRLCQCRRGGKLPAPARETLRSGCLRDDIPPGRRTQVVPAPSARLSAANIGGYALAAAALIAASLTQRRPRGKPVVEWSDLDDLMAVRAHAHRRLRMYAPLVPLAGMMLCEYTADPRTTLLRPRRLSGLDCSTGGGGREIAPLRTTSTTSASMNRRGSLCCFVRSTTCMQIRCKTKRPQREKCIVFRRSCMQCGVRTGRRGAGLVQCGPHHARSRVGYGLLIRDFFASASGHSIPLLRPTVTWRPQWPCVCWQAGLIFSGSTFSVLGIRPHGLERATVQHVVAS